MFALSLPSVGICEWSGPWGEALHPSVEVCPRACAAPAQPAGRRQLPPHPSSGNYPAVFSPPLERVAGRLPGLRGST